MSKCFSISEPQQTVGTWFNVGWKNVSNWLKHKR